MLKDDAVTLLTNSLVGCCINDPSWSMGLTFLLLVVDTRALAEAVTLFLKVVLFFLSLPIV